jgi:hypothetical protein
MDLDGSNRREVIRLEAMEEISIEDSLFVDNEDNLYFIVLRASQKELRRLDLSSGKCETLLTTGMGMVCRHSYDDNIVLEYYDGTLSVYSVDEIELQTSGNEYTGVIS